MWQNDIGFGIGGLFFTAGGFLLYAQTSVAKCKVAMAVDVSAVVVQKDIEGNGEGVVLNSKPQAHPAHDVLVRTVHHILSYHINLRGKKVHTNLCHFLDCKKESMDIVDPTHEAIIYTIYANCKFVIPPIMMLSLHTISQRLRLSYEFHS